MKIITDSSALQPLCDSLAQAPFITIDTEFLRDKTYYPQLCLVQVAPPEGDPVAIDPLAKGMDLTPLFELMANENVVKVFHAARQDLEIFYNLAGEIPTPIFDTQVAAMVCGYGEQVGYHNLIGGICGHSIDKGPQFTDWSRRPLSDRQLRYALDDVTFLRQAYLHLKVQLEERDRTDWVSEEMDILRCKDTYENDPEKSWQRIKIKSARPGVLSILKEVAAWREHEAQRRNVPRNRVLRDEAIADISIHPPKKSADLKKIRNMPGDIPNSKWGLQIVEVVAKGLAVPKDECPSKDYIKPMDQDMKPVLEMLKMLLRIQSSEHQVAAKLIAGKGDLEAIVMDDNAPVMALKGWRRKVFGAEAIAMKNGKLALSLENGQITKKKV